VVSMAGGVTRAKGLDPINQSLRSGGIRSLIVLGSISAVHAVLLAQLFSRPQSASHWTWVGLSMLWGTLLIAHTWGALRSMRTRFTEEGLVVEGLSETTSIRWSDVVRLRRESRRIVLERVGAPATVVSLWYVTQPDELHAAIRTLVPNRALQRTDS
jgi:hypothetical protein